jgi:hypothetical protein
MVLIVKEGGGQRDGGGGADRGQWLVASGWRGPVKTSQTGSNRFENWKRAIERCLSMISAPKSVSEYSEPAPRGGTRPTGYAQNSNPLQARFLDRANFRIGYKARKAANFAGSILGCFLALGSGLQACGAPDVFSEPQQNLERTCFQTHAPWQGDCDLRSDVAIVYGFDSTLAQRIQSWRDHGYRIHLMTGVAWGNYQDYLHGKFDGHNHEDEEQTNRDGHAHGHGGGAYYMCPSTNYGNYLCAGVRRALEAGVEAVHLEEPEFWVQDGYSPAFKREWQQFYGELWQPPHSSVDAQWRASNLKYFLYRHASSSMERNQLPAVAARTVRHRRRPGRIHRRPGADFARPVYKSI